MKNLPFFLLISCAFLLIFITQVFSLGKWADPPGGWTGLFTFDNLKGKTLKTDDKAALDGEWNHDNGSDEWAGNAPGTAGKAPGGVAINVLPGEGDPSGDAVVLSIEDTGDPTAKGFADPNNRKIYLEHEVPFKGNIFSDGVTFIARWRVNPKPVEAPADGYTLHDGGKGEVGIIHDGGLGGDGVTLDLSFALDTGGLLYFGNENQPPLNVGDEFKFHTVWATAKQAGGMCTVKIYMDGSLKTIFSGDMTLGDGSDASFGNYIAVGLGSTARDGAIQIDYVGYKTGVFTPTPYSVEPFNKLPGIWGKLKLGGEQ